MYVAGGKEWDVVKKSQISSTYKCLMCWAEENLMHVFHPILNMGYGVHVIDLVLGRWEKRQWRSGLEQVLWELWIYW